MFRPLAPATPSRWPARLGMALALAVVPALPGVGCGPSGGGGGGDGGGITLSVTPASTEVDLAYGQTSDVTYQVTAHFPDGSTSDVTTDTALAVEQDLGSFQGSVLTLTGHGAGVGHVTATYQGATGTAEVTVKVTSVRVDPSAPADAPDKFGSASEDPSLAPTLVYPQEGTMVPRNLGDFETHWTGATGDDLYQVEVAGTYVTVDVYTSGNPAGAFASLTLGEWSLLSRSEVGAALAITVRGMKSASPGAAGTSTPLHVSTSDEDLQGGIYYWASAGSLPEGIYRHDLSKPGQPAQQFYTKAESPSGRCVACHALSRDGERMAITLDGGNGSSTVLDVATRQPVVTLDTYYWNFATFTRDHSRAITSHQGVLTLRDGNTMAPLGNMPGSGYATQPELSPDGTKLVYVVSTSPTSDWSFTGGSVVVRSFDQSTGSFGSPTTVVPNPGKNVYYPSWSPDGQWLAFNESTGDAYDDPDATVYVIKADGSVGPIPLDTVNLSSGLDNSWVRWAPFQQTLHTAAGDEPLFWLTFSSKRAFGVRLPAGRPQVWMAPFFPARAAAGNDPTTPAFRLPFQELSTSNHIAQWTERVVDVD